MIHPNVEIIVNSTLFVNGFAESKALTTKIVQFIEIFGKLFPYELSYDLGKTFFIIEMFIF